MRGLKGVFIFCILIGALVVFYLFPDDPLAMPGFARKYDAPCSSCHIAFPKLNDYGIEFRQRGFREEDEGPGEPVWRLPGIPMGGMVDAFYELKNDDGRVPKQSSKVVVGHVHFLAGGVLGPNVSFFGDLLGNLDGETDLVPKHFFIVFNDILPKSRLNLKMGAYHVDFPFLSDHRIPTRAHYLTRVTATGSEEIAPGSRGAEINGFFTKTQTRYALGIRKASVVNSPNQMQSFYGWFTQTKEILGFDQTLGVWLLRDKNGDKSAGTDDGTQSYGGVFDLHYGLTGVIIGFFHYDGGMSEVLRVYNSGLVEILHSFTLPQKDLIGVARFDFQKAAGSQAEAFQYIANLQYFYLPNVKGQSEVSYRLDQDALGNKSDEKTATLSIVFAF